MADVDLSTLDFFDGFSEKELKKVRGITEDVSAEAGAVLMEQGRPGRDCYIVCSGEAGVYVGGERVATVKEGSVVGEMALIDHNPRSATVKALTDMELLRLDVDAFSKLLQEFPEASRNLMSALQQRLRDQNFSR